MSPSLRDSSATFTTTLVEPDKTDALNLTEGVVTEYIRQYVCTAQPAGSSSVLPEDSSRFLFLSRNLTAKGQDCSEEAIPEALKQVRREAAAGRDGAMGVMN